MSKFLKGECGVCGGHIEFPAEAAGETVECPHCGKPTELLLATPVSEPTIGLKTIVYTGVAVLVLVGGLVGAMVLQRRAKQLVDQKQSSSGSGAEKTPKPPNPFADVAFRASSVTIEKATGSSLIYAVGSIRNLTNSQRFQVKVELDLFDASGQRLNGDTNRPSDYQRLIEPLSEWRFQAPVLNKKAVSAKVVSIQEKP